MCGDFSEDWAKVGDVDRGWSPPHNGIWDPIHRIDENFRWRGLIDLKQGSWLSTVFKHAALSETSDPRDRVYAIRTRHFLVTWESILTLLSQLV